MDKYKIVKKRRRLQPATLLMLIIKQKRIFDIFEEVMMSIRQKGVLLVAMLLLSGAFAAEKVTFDNNWTDNPLFNVVSETSLGIEVIFSMHEMVVEEMDIDGVSMKTFGIPGIFLPPNEGSPNLSRTGRYFAIPQGAKASVTILDSRTEVYHNVEVAPAPNIPFDTDDSPLCYVKDIMIYGKNAYYPDKPAKLSEPLKIRGVDAVILGISPFQYNPITKELIVYKDIRVRVDFIGGNGQFGDDRLRTRFWEPILQGNLLNYNSLPDIDFYAPERINARSGYEYIIIVPDDAVFEAWGDTIKNWRRLQGISSEVFTLTEVGGNTPEAIKDFLTNAYNNWNPAPVAFLLLSDYPTSGDVYGITSQEFPHPYSGTYVTDNWYAEMVGNALPNMDYARICAQTEVQLSTMINKFLSYEREPYTASNFYNEPLVSCGWQTERWFQLCAEVIRGFFVNSLGKAPARQYGIYSGSPTPGCTWSTASNTSTVVSYWASLGYIPMTNPYDATWWSNGSAGGITNAINSGAFLVQHRDHGGVSGWGTPSYTTGDLNGLSNTMFTFVYSTNCLTGKYNSSSECFAEKFHRIDYGALGVNAASQVSYSFVNDTYVWGCYDGLWPEFDPNYPTADMTGYENLRPCQAMTYGKYYLSASSWPSNSSRKAVTYRLFHHHGDAFNTIYSEIPQNLTVSHDPTLTAGETSFTVTADDNAVIALTVNYEIIGVAEGTGSPVAISIEPQSPGNIMKVTVTKANHYRYKADVPIVPATGPYPIASTTIIDDGIGGNNDGIVNPGETIDYGIYLKNVGDENAVGVYAKLFDADPYITINSDSSWYGNIPVNDSVLSDPYYNFMVADNCPNNHTVICSLAIYDIAGTLYVSHPEFTVYAPILVFQGYSVVGDNNGDGILDPGETADLVVTIKNTGDGAAYDVTSILETTSPYITINDTIGNFGTINPHTTRNNSSDPYNIYAAGTTPEGIMADFCVIVQSGIYCDTLEFSLMVGHLPPSDTTKNYVPAEFGQEWSSITFGSTNYLVVWQDNRKANEAQGEPYDIYAARVTPSGALIDTGGILIPGISGTADKREPAVASDGTNYLVVWYNRDGSAIDLYGARVSQDGVVLDIGGFPISTATNAQRIPSVGFNGTNYLVAWADKRMGNWQMYCARVTPEGTVLDPGGIPLQQIGNYSDIVSNGSDWLIAWDTGSLIYGTRVSSDGTVLDPGGFVISSAANDRYWPDLAFDGTNYFAVWQDRRSGTAVDCWAIYGARITQGGTVLDPGGIPIIADDSKYTGIPEISFNSTNYLVVWKDDGYDEMTGARVTPAGVVLDPGGFPITETPNENELWHDVACDGINWFVVWDDYRWRRYGGECEPWAKFGWGPDIAGTRVDPEGVVLDPYPNIGVSIVTNWQWLPDVAFDGTNALVVWQEKVDAEHLDIYGTRIGTNGSVLDIPPLRICSENTDEILPSVAFGNTNYLVVCNRWQEQTIYGARVGLDGTILDPSPGIFIGTCTAGYPDVAFDGTNYLVVWWKYASLNYHIYGARVTQDGVVLEPGGFDIATVTYTTGWNLHVDISLAFDGTNYLVVWPDYRNSNYDIYGARIAPDGTVLDPGGFPVCKTIGDQDFPNLAFGAGYYFAVWHAGGGDIYGTWVDTSGTSIDTLGIPISTAPGAQSQPSVGFIGNRYVVSWRDERNGNPDVYSARIDIEGNILDPNGVEISTEAYRQWQPCISPGPDSKALIVYSGYTDYPYCASRLYHQMKTITPLDIVPPSAPYVYVEKTEASPDDVKLTWNKITTDTLGNAENMDYYTVYRGTSPDFIPGTSDSIAGVTHPDTTYIDVGALSTNDSYYYLIKAVDEAQNRSTKSNMGYKFNKFVNENAGATGDRNWVSLPWYNGYDSVPDLTADLSPSGNPLTKITNLGDDQVFENWIHHPVLGWYGDTFDINAGRGYEMIAVADDTVFLVGSNDPTGFIPLNENPGAVGDRNWLSIPYNAIYGRAIDITNEYSSGGEAVIKITNLRNDQVFENWIYHPVLGWYGDTFDISAGRGYEFVAVLDTTWNPTEYTNESDFDRLMVRHKSSDTKVRLGSLTRSDRAPLWIVDEPASKKTVSRVEPEDIRNDGCLAKPKSEKSVKSVDEHDVKVYKPVSRSVSAKKNLELCREAGVSHVVRAEFDAKEYTDIVFTAYRLNKPYDVLTEQVIGGGIAQKHNLGVLWFDVGNFMRPWQHGEEVILIAEALHEHGAYCQVIRFRLDQGVDIQELGKLEFEPIPVPEPILKTAVSWPKSKNAQVIGFSVYQGDIRANNEVIQAKEYSGGKDITLKLVIKGGYETVYNSGSKRSEYGPVVNLPRVYAFTVYPNPFIKKTMINYALPEPGQVSILVYDVTGRKIMTLVNDRVDPGYYQMHWSGCDDLGRQISAGVYFMRMNTPGFTSQQKVIFIR